MKKSTAHPTSPSTQPTNQNHPGDQKNANIGTKGTNQIYDKVHGNRGKQLDPNRKD